MKLLVDTNILIDIRKNAPGDFGIYKKVMYKNSIYISGVVRAELLHGAYSEKNRRELHSILEMFPQIDLNGNDWEIFGDHLYEYRTHGITIPFTDAILATISTLNDLPVWTNDKHFDMMKNVLPNLKIYQTKDLI